ncbi:MAG: translocation/assembly module TamB domain-containing protein, partial [Candidatus Eisenbacteria sp.]|nr:translocation/assembly module TamB domain-containing protein [Candidatus Eisenbacteria bacterium]
EGRELVPLTVGGVDLGVLALSTDARGVTANVPGLMLPDEFGRVVLSGKDGEHEFLLAGPSESPLLWGEVEFSDLSFTYPFIGSGGHGFGDLMSDSEWSLRMTAGRNLWYWRADANLNVERGSGLDFLGVPSEHSMCVSGRVTSTRGTVTYLHTEFAVREVSVEFPGFCEQPRFHVDAETRVADGTIISLSMHATEGVPALAMSGVTLDESALVLNSDSPDDNTPEKIMSKLQYGVSYDLLEAEEQAALERRRAVDLIGTQIGLRVARPLLAPIESRIRRNLNLDLVRIDIDFVEHFLSQLDMWTASEGTAQYVPNTLNTRMTLGKYISRDWLVSYLGVVESYEEDIGESALGLRSELGIEYEVSRNTSLSLRVVYDPALAGWDRRVSIENRYEF